MTKEEQYLEDFMGKDWRLYNESYISVCLKEYADQQTSELKAELVKATETAKVTSVTQRQHIERLQNELAENDKEIERLKIKNMLLVQKNCVLKDINDDIQSELNELKERHKKDVIGFADFICFKGYTLIQENISQNSAMFFLNKNSIGVSSIELYEQYKQKFESND